MTDNAADETDAAAAIERMRGALLLLDRAGLAVAACHLQMAIDVASTTLDGAARGSGARRSAEIE